MAIVSLLVIYAPVIGQVAAHWKVHPDYAQVWLIPVFCIALTLRSWWSVGWPQCRRIAPAASRMACVLIAGGLVAHSVAWLTGFLLLDMVSLCSVLWGFVWFTGGRKASRHYGLPIALLLLVGPLPYVWRQPCALWLQNLVSSAATGILWLVGVPVVREGHHLWLPGQMIEVAEACSGMRQINVFLATSILSAGLYRLTPLRRWLVIGAALPSAVVANTLRIVLTALVLIVAGPKWASGTFHMLEGLAVVAIAVMLLTAWARWLSLK